MYLIRQILSSLHVVNFIGVLQAAEGFEVSLFLQDRDEIICVTVETSRNDVSYLHFHIIWLKRERERIQTTDTRAFTEEGTICKYINLTKELY